TLSLADEGRDPAGFAQALGACFERFGFAVVADHGIDSALIECAWAETRAFFALPAERKAAYNLPGKAGARVYTPFGIEIAKDAKQHDLKEFWHVGRELPAG